MPSPKQPILVPVRYRGQPRMSKVQISAAETGEVATPGGMLTKELKPARYRVERDLDDRVFPVDKTGALAAKWVLDKYRFIPPDYELAIPWEDAREIVNRWPELFEQVGDVDAAMTVTAAADDISMREEALEARQLKQDKALVAMDEKLEKVVGKSAKLAEENKRLKEQVKKLKSKK